MHVKVISEEYDSLSIEVDGEHLGGYDPSDQDASSISHAIDAIIVQARKGTDIQVSFENYYD